MILAPNKWIDRLMKAFNRRECWHICALARMPDGSLTYQDASYSANFRMRPEFLPMIRTVISEKIGCSSSSVIVLSMTCLGRFVKASSLSSGRNEGASNDRGEPTALGSSSVEENHLDAIPSFEQTEQELEQIKKDAERYRWLRDHDNGFVFFSDEGVDQAMRENRPIERS